MATCKRGNPHEPARNTVDLGRLAKLDAQYNKVMTRIRKPGDKGPPLLGDDAVMLQFMSIAGMDTGEMIKDLLDKVEKR